jgi:manganese/iron transport system permease protein/iron/zinc/copper transport system permease protein
MQILGVTLIAAALVVPAITARLMTDSFHRMTVYSVLIGASSGFVGMYVSYYVDVASGATIVILQAIVFACVLFIGVARKRVAQRLIHTHV